jgi:hemerythrin-like domain-containing protein
MPDTLRLLRDDHANLRRLLDVLDHQVTLFAEDADPDYDVMQGVLEYFARYPDLEHHPREDIALRKLEQRDPAGAAAVGDLTGEHERLRAETERFMTALSDVLGEVEVPRDAFVEQARDTVAQIRQHMRTEEELFFPRIERALSDTDWQDIEAAAERRADPVFGPRTVAECRALRDHLLAWDAEDRAQGA